ncbi:AarF/ABC1/UbiB kinase family protein [Bacillus timonensis]|uniref:AarF/ABC1/UbiB kinase family protein n=1 Tax=Bacillus timonensis TaxID=1033734 RepID=A0A4S3PLU6_9BACI|nr:AarF/UbiB family protein [Bacillus timonensis]THE10429.1 AarF/ABC1/UbiB kinase family protein [Bacillus timonensis]
METRNKMIRMSKVLSMAFWIFLKIYWFKFRKKPQQEWDKLWTDIGVRFRKTLFELEGLLIKVGQILSTRADLLPEPFIKQIQDLTDQVPSSDWTDIEEILKEEWGSSTYGILQSIEKEAIASASIGEVYKGILTNGEKIAVKVQRPHIQSILKTDFRTLVIIIWFADHFVPVPKGFINFKVLFKEIKQVIERELDYSKELHTLEIFKERFQEHDDVIIPKVYPEYSTSRVFVMEWVDGIKISDVANLQTMDRKHLAQSLMELFLPQWLEPGLFHADPHPGNVLLSKEGKIILLDFGMVGEISKKDATNFQRLVESFLTKNYSKAVECLSQLGFLLPESDHRTMEKLLEEWMSFDLSQLKEIDLIAFKREMNDVVHALPIQVPTRFVFLGRSFVAIEGIILHLIPEEEVVDLVKPVFMNWLHKSGNQKWSFILNWIQALPVFKIFHSVQDFLQLPHTLENLKEVEQRREFQFTIYENNKKHVFLLSLFGFTGIVASILASHSMLLYLTAGLTAISGVGYALVSHKQKKWLKYMHEKRK